MENTHFCPDDIRGWELGYWTRGFLVLEGGSVGGGAAEAGAGHRGPPGRRRVRLCRYGGTMDPGRLGVPLPGVQRRLQGHRRSPAEPRTPGGYPAGGAEGGGGRAGGEGRLLSEL